MKKVLVVLFLMFSVVLAGGPASASFFDDFNRADSSNLGPNWTTNGSIGIAGQWAHSTSSAPNWAQVNGYSTDYLSTRLWVDVKATEAQTQYVALMFGILDSSQNIFIKVQDNDGSGNFNRAFFYYGNNGSHKFSNSFFDLTPFTTARMSVYAPDANTARLEIDTNFDGVADQTYSVTGLQGLALGQGIGLGMYGNAWADNYGTVPGSVVPLPASLLLLGPGLVGLAAIRRRFRK